MATKLKGPFRTSSGGSSQTHKVTSIRANIMRRVLPTALLPLIALGLLSIAGILLLEQRTIDAVESAEEVLTEQVVAESVQRSSARASREIADYLEEWAVRIRKLNNRPEVREATVGNDRTRRKQLLALTSSDELTTFETKVQVLIVSSRGNALGSSHPDETSLDYSGADWFLGAKESGSSVRSFVDDGEGEPAVEMAIWTNPPTGQFGGGVIRVRIPLYNVQWILDEVARDNAVDVVLIDTASSILLADTANAHDLTLLYGASDMMVDETGLNRELLTPGTIQDDERVIAAESIGARLNASNRSSFEWLVQTSQPFNLAGSALAEIQEVNNEVSSIREILIIAFITLLLGALVLSFLAVRGAANQITRPVQALSDRAREAADNGIPSIVAAARTSEELPDLPDFETDSNDELAILAHSMNTMQDAAVDLAAGQAKLRRQNVARTFVSLGRRNQNLLNRQLEFIDELEQKESDADALENLFRLDHLATRMRRNAENLLVLAGEQTPRRWGKPIAVRDVLRAAASEIADYRRVRLGEIDPATVSGGLATDLSHLIAELLENAGSFSPPTTPVEVLGQHTSTHYRLAIVDQGIGMDAQALAQVNDRLKNPVDFADAPSAYLGLFVVGRLAQEMGITVRLASADPTGEGRRRGTIAFIDLPVALLSTDAASPIEINERSSEGVAHRTEAVDAAQNAPAAEPTPPPIPTPQPQPQPQPVVAEAPAAAVKQTTTAGFPKRSRGATSVNTTPTIMETSKPAVAPVDAPAPIEAAVPIPVPVPAPPATEITAAGFPKRHASGPLAAAPAPMPEPVATAAPKRDASEVSNSLRSIRAAVARGRASGATPAPLAPERTSPETDSLSPPPVPIAPGAPAAPTPEANSTAQDLPSPPITNLPTQSGSES